MLGLAVTICAKLKVKRSIYFVKNMFSVILHIFSTKLKHKNEARKVKSMNFTFRKYIDNLYSLILPDNIVIYLSLAIIIW